MGIRWSEVVSAAFIASLLILAYAAAGLIAWALLWVGVFGLVAIFEAYLWFRHKTTLSEQFGAFWRHHFAWGFLLWLLTAMTFLILLLHLKAMR